MKFGKFLSWAAVAALCVLCAMGVREDLNYREATFTEIDGVTIRRDVTQLDYRGKPVSQLGHLEELSQLQLLDLRDTGLTPRQYERLRAALPGCEILWSVPFQGGYLEQDTAEIAVTYLQESDFAALSYLPELQTVDATCCPDLDAVLALQAAYPQLHVHYTVPLGEKALPETATEVVANNATAEDILPLLRYLPQLQKITFTGTAPDNALIATWMADYPQITFLWDFALCGIPVNSMTTQLDLSGIPMESVEEVEAALPCFYQLERIDMSDCGIPSEELDALWKRHPETRIVWTVSVGDCRLPTDITAFMPYHYGYDGFRVLRDSQTTELKYCVDIECMDMGHMEISDYSFLRYMPHMKYLILADTMGKDFSPLAELKELVYLEIFMTRFDQAEVLTGLTSLEDLNIGNSAIDNIDPLLEMTWLKRLWLPGNIHLDGNERKLLRDSLADTQIVFACEGSTGGGWREGENYYTMRDLLGMPYFVG